MYTQQTQVVVQRPRSIIGCTIRIIGWIVLLAFLYGFFFGAGNSTATTIIIIVGFLLGVRPIRDYRFVQTFSSGRQRI